MNTSSWLTVRCYVLYCHALNFRPTLVLPAAIPLWADASQNGVFLTALWDVRSDTFRSGFQGLRACRSAWWSRWRAEQFLHGAHVRAALDQVRGKGNGARCADGVVW